MNAMEEKKLPITVIMQFEGGGELALDNTMYTTLDIQRNNKKLNINATNTAGGLVFNSLYDEIIEKLGENETFDIIMEQGGGGAAFGGMLVDYHLNADREILTFGQKIEEKQENERVE